MATAAQRLSDTPSALMWFWEFLKEELAPNPGRAEVVTRIVVAATIVMVLTMTFRIPYGAYAAIYTFIISRESPRETVKSAITEALAFVCSIVHTLIGAMLFVSHPMMRLLWITATLFLMFYALQAVRNYTAAVRFGWLMVITIPLWDQHITAEAKLEGTLWAVGALLLASVVTAAVELLFAVLKPGDELVSPLAQRLDAVKKVLEDCAADDPADKKSEKEIIRLALLGTSNLRRILQRSGYVQHYVEQMGGVIVLVGRLVDIAANVTRLTAHNSDGDRQRIQELAQNVSAIREDLLNKRVPRLVHELNGVSPASPLIAEMERTLSLIAEVFAGSHPLGGYRSSGLDHGDPPPTLFVRDALSPEHIKFALKGCLAASLCYVIYNGADWPGISTAVTTCFLTALTTIGASRQKQFLRIIGAVTGGAMGIAIQVFILPQLDSIAGFTVLFITIIAGTAWVATAGPRLSYAGLQAAVPFCIINLEGFRIQTDLALARDRVAGVLLGLFMMWFVFDQLWGAPALGQMRKTFISTLRLLGQFAKEPLSRDPRVAADRSYSIREGISKNFEETRALADAVLFEFGPSREQALLWRDRIVRWQPQVRVLFLTRIALWKYRAQLPGFELPEAVQAAQQEFDHELAQKLDSIAKYMDEGTMREQMTDNSLGRLEQTIQTYSSKTAYVPFAAHFQAFLSLCRTAEDLTDSLEKEVKASWASVAR